ncbi:hypothetical protein WR25_04890 [Diploscapter pachys]|uniref:Large ribosomal subunit protein uL22m n=1 Tax=Diploscapter pachys TaxID=2018661 RepID=A0A2A2L1C1_9BILA|nr:hypothetical protein WR25_04890 [Diploscapter pachys]
MFKVCKFVNKMMVDEAIAQCKIRALKGTLMMAEILEEAKKRASSEFNIEYPSTMYVADAFAIQSEIVKGAKRHAHEVWHVHRYRYVHVFVRLEEGPPPPTAYRYPMPNGWEKMKKYVDYLHNRTVKYGL